MVALTPCLRGLSRRQLRLPNYRRLDPVPTRSIPACAGEPSQHFLQDSLDEVYPRVCGGTPPHTPPLATLPGLSPRVRGNPSVMSRIVFTTRSIPACAGEPAGPWANLAVARVYPRVCGGTGRGNDDGGAGGGLSPRVRGNLVLLGVYLIGMWSIPACAGEPCSTLTHRSDWGVYPRVCGGTPREWVSRSTTGGLSPRVRGNPSVALKVAQCRGSIPACAGEPVPAVPAALVSGVYPRVCGGTADCGFRNGVKKGLSPRVRGNHLPAGLLYARPRSIPACAGEPSSPPCCGPDIWVYPRVCGGTLDLHECLATVVGLSPRVRGNLQPPQSLYFR